MNVFDANGLLPASPFQLRHRLKLFGEKPHQAGSTELIRIDSIGRLLRVCRQRQEMRGGLMNANHLHSDDT